MRIYSWNVNGLRAVAKKNFLEWIGEENPDILCIQETKLQENQLEDNIIAIYIFYIIFKTAGKSIRR